MIKLKNMTQVMEKLKEEFRGKKVLVVGLGVQGGGVGVIKFLAKLGAKIKVTDLKTEEQLKESLSEISHLGIDTVLGKHDVEDFISADIIFKGPSVPWSLPGIIEAEKRGIPIEMEMSFFSVNCPGKIIGITGTRGKSTTTMMIYKLMKKNNFSVYLGGNIPQVSTIALLETVTANDWVVLELPSWPLSGFHRKKISPHIAVFTNFYPDHLNYYKTMDDYLYDKKAIYLYQKSGDYLVINYSLRNLVEKESLRSKVIYFSASDFPMPLKRLLGSHNLENAAACQKTAEIVGIDFKKAVEFISDFNNLPFRQEVIANKEGVVVINDSASTMPIATIKALETYSGKPIVLILGGNSKNLPYDELLSKINQAEKVVLLTGDFTDKILPSLKSKLTDRVRGPFDNLEEAVLTAYNEAKNLASTRGEKVYLIFSPGATSFAMFRNEFHRGDEYNKIIGKILGDE